MRQGSLPPPEKSRTFATLFSYEWGGGLNAHRNVYYSETPGKLFDAHDEHTREFHAEYQRLVEVCSCWGNSETHGRSSVQEALFMGHRLGVVGGTDTHFSQPGRSAFGPFELGGLTAVVCDRLDRRSLWQALHARRCYATTGERILMDFRVNGNPMGSEICGDGVREVTGRIVPTSEPESVEIVRNNSVWRSVAVTGESEVAFELEDDEELAKIALEPRLPLPGRFVFYYLSVSQKDRHWAMSSPVWVVRLE